MILTAQRRRKTYKWSCFNTTTTLSLKKKKGSWILKLSGEAKEKDPVLGSILSGIPKLCAQNSGIRHASFLFSSRAPWVWQGIPPEPSYTQHLCCRPGNRELLRWWSPTHLHLPSAPGLISTGRVPASRFTGHTFSIPDLYLPAHGPRQKPKPNYCLFPLSPPPQVNLGSVTALIFSQPLRASDPSGSCQDSLSASE